MFFCQSVEESNVTITEKHPVDVYVLSNYYLPFVYPSARGIHRKVFKFYICYPRSRHDSVVRSP